MTETVEEYIRCRLHAMLDALPTCPRCETIYFFDDGRCRICGMLPDVEGPPPHRIMQSITAAAG